MKKFKYIMYAVLMSGIAILLIFIGNRLSTNKYSNELISKSAFYFDTFITIQVYDSQENYSDTISDKDALNELIENAISLCARYELIFSKTNEESELYQVNQATGQSIRISKELYEVIEKAMYYSELSSGKFDITVSKLTDLWNYKNATVPSTDILNESLKTADYNNITLSVINDNYYISVKNNATIDLGSIAKGFIADKIKYYLTKHGVESAIINLGGNMVVIGDKPDHSSYTIGIQKPFAKDNTTICSVKVKDKSVVTSGIYERIFESNGKLYHHIIDPDTGYPSDSGLCSATIIADDSIDADALSTTCILLGFSDALELINSIDGVECILITDDYEIILSNGLERVGTVISYD